MIEVPIIVPIILISGLVASLGLHVLDVATKISKIYERTRPPIGSSADYYNSLYQRERRDKRWLESENTRLKRILLDVPPKQRSRKAQKALKEYR